MTGKKITLAIAGRPLTFEGLPVLVARDAGLFKKYGVDVEIKIMTSGAASAKTVVEGNLDLALAPTQFAIRLMANAVAPLKAFWGLDRSDWLLASMDAGQMSCAAMSGARVGVDHKRGTRWTQLNTILKRGCKLSIDRQVKTVALGTDVGAALASGKLVHGILHVDELKAIELKTGKMVHVVKMLEAVSHIHNMMLVARRSGIEANRDALVRVVAALREACAIIYDPGQMARVVQSARPIQRNEKVAEAAIRALTEMSYYPRSTPGLDWTRVTRAINNQVRIGKLTRGRSGISPKRGPPNYEEVADISLWADARGLK